MGLPKGGAALFLVAALTTSCGGSDTPSPDGHRQAVSVADEGLIVAVGDSLTAGLGVREEAAWPALLERRLRKEGYPWKVHNAGMSGETSSGARGRTGWILRLEPDIVVLETGANDGLRGIPPKVMRENIDTILEALENEGVVAVLAGMRMVTNLGEEYTGRFAQVYAGLAEKHGVIFIPFILEGVAGNPSLNQSDGIHPTADGHSVMMENAYPYVVEAIEKVRRSR